MEPNKMEQEFKRKLELREIDPTPHAWDRLEAVLNEADSKKQVRKINWLYVAAAILGFALLGTVVFRDWKRESREVVHQDKKKPVQAPAQDFLPKTQRAKTEVASQEKMATPVSKQDGIVLRHKETSVLKTPSPQTQIAIVNQAAQLDKSKPSETNQPTNTPANETADVQLADAGTSHKSVKVDARALLDQVDGELDQSFREKVLSGVSKKYQDVKVALANRNRE